MVQLHQTLVQRRLPAPRQLPEKLHQRRPKLPALLLDDVTKQPLGECHRGGNLCHRIFLWWHRRFLKSGGNDAPSFRNNEVAPRGATSATCRQRARGETGIRNQVTVKYRLSPTRGGRNLAEVADQLKLLGRLKLDDVPQDARRKWCRGTNTWCHIIHRRQA